MRPESYPTPGGISVTRTISKVPYARGLHALLHKLDTQRGIYFSSGYEYPERYSRWDFAARRAAARNHRRRTRDSFAAAQRARRNAEPHSGAVCSPIIRIGRISRSKTARCTGR